MRARSARAGYLTRLRLRNTGFDEPKKPLEPDSVVRRTLLVWIALAQLAAVPEHVEMSVIKKP